MALNQKQRMALDRMLDQQASLDEKIEELGSIESALRIAMEELGLVLPDSVVITPGN